MDAIPPSESAPIATLTSGGPDSAVLLAWAAEQGFHQRAFLLAGGRHAGQRELASARFHTERYGVPLEVVQMPPSDGLVARMRSQTTSADPGVDGCVRRLFTLGASVWVAGLALLRGCGTLAIGLHRDDLDLEPALVDALETLQNLLALVVGDGTGRDFQVLVPFRDSARSSVLTLGLRLGVPFEQTWSCYQDGEEPCRSCVGCRERADAFRRAGLSDPLCSYPRSPSS